MSNTTKTEIMVISSKLFYDKGIANTDLQTGNNSTSLEQNKVFVKAAYKMYKNLYAYVMFGEYDKESNDKSTIRRINIQY
ncbi:MAG: hypothetical protein U5K55_01160 [Aliarcobacter sp.]|nr:hypothetical protein [Aliarcobacter sp.]